MRHRHLTLMHGGRCPCESCNASRFGVAIALLVIAAMGLIWLFWGGGS